MGVSDDPGMQCGKDWGGALDMMMHDIQDYYLMHVLGNPVLGRATSTPITLATVGLSGEEVKAIARSLRK